MAGIPAFRSDDARAARMRVPGMGASDERTITCARRDPQRSRRHRGPPRRQRRRPIARPGLAGVGRILIVQSASQFRGPAVRPVVVRSWFGRYGGRRSRVHHHSQLRDERSAGHRSNSPPTHGRSKSARSANPGSVFQASFRTSIRPRPATSRNRNQGPDIRREPLKRRYSFDTV